MRWRIGNCIFDKTRRQVWGPVETHLNYRQGRLLEFLIENYGQPYKDKEMIRAVWEGQSAEGSLHKYIAVLRDALGGERKSCIDTDPYRLTVEPRLLDDDELTNDRGTLPNVSDAPQRDQLESRSLPSDLENRIDALQLASPVADAVRKVLTAEKFPTIMTLSTDVVINPIWEKILPDDRQRLAADFSPFGSMLRRFIDIDIYLLRANDARGNPYLLKYFSGKPKSGWQAYLFPFRYKSPGESEQVRQAENAKIMAGYFLMSPSDFSSESLGDQFVVSVKPDVGYSSELVTYIFKFCSVTMRTAPEWLSCIEPQLKNGQSVQKFRWVHAGELELDDRSVLVNGDVLRGIHQFFGTSIPSVPVGFPGILETGN